MNLLELLKRQPSDTDMGSKDPLDVKIIGELYGLKSLILLLRL